MFDAERNHVRTFGQQGAGPGQLSYPSGLATTADGLLFVPNYSNSCVDVFREDGTFIRRIGQGQLSYPIDVAVHANGQVYVADSSYHRVTVLTQDMVSWFTPLDHTAVVLDSLVTPMALLSHQTGRCMSVTTVTDECKSSLLMARTSGCLDKASSVHL